MKRLAAAVAVIALLVVPVAPASAARCNEACRMKRVLVSQDPSWRVIPQKNIGKLGKDICWLLDDGLDHLFMVNFIEKSGLDNDMAIQLVAASVVVRCPWNQL